MIMTYDTRTISGVLFDWDLTLARALGDVPRSQRLTILFQEGGFLCSHDEVQQAMRALLKADLSLETRPLGKPPQTQTDIIAYYRRLLAQLGYPRVSLEKATELYENYARLPTALYADVLPALRSLHARGIRLGIVSNHTSVARDMMERLVGEFIQPAHILISDELGLYKPSPAVFTRATEQLGLPAAECAFVGDNLEVDAIAAVRQGGYQVGFWLDREQGETPFPFTLPRNVILLRSLGELLHHL